MNKLFSAFRIQRRHSEEATSMMPRWGWPLPLLVVLLSGCVIVPAPRLGPEFASDRFSPAHLYSIRTGAATTDGVRAVLGSADFERDGGQIRIYVSEEKHGTWEFITLFEATSLGAIYTQTRVLVLEFDSDGILRNKEFAGQIGDGDERYCSEDQVCLVHKFAIGTKPGSNTVIRGFHGVGSAVTVNGKAKRRAQAVELQATKCRLTIWPDSDWARSGGSSSDSVPTGLVLKVEGPDEGGVRIFTWLPLDAFAAIALTAGVYTVKVVDPRRGDFVFRGSEPEVLRWGSAPFDCTPGADTYLAIGASKEDGDRFRIVLRPMDAVTAQGSIANMPRVLLQ